MSHKHKLSQIITLKKNISLVEYEDSTDDDSEITPKKKNTFEIRDTLNHETVHNNNYESGLLSKSYLNWENNSNICWLDASMSLIVHNRTLNCAVSANRCAQIFSIIKNYHKAINILNDHFSEKAVEVRIDIAKNILRKTQESSLKYLQPILKNKDGEPDSAFCSLYNLIKEDKVIRNLFEVEFNIYMNCSNCKMQRSRKDKKIIITLTKCLQFEPTSPESVCICPTCKQMDLKLTLVYKTLPQCFLFHFENGAGEGVLQCTEFSINERIYKLTGIMTLEKGTESEVNHFVTWIRHSSTESWLECNDLNSDIESFSCNTLLIEQNDIYILMYEAFDNLGTIAHKSQFLNLINKTSINNSIVKGNAEDILCIDISDDDDSKTHNELINPTHQKGGNKLKELHLVPSSLNDTDACVMKSLLCKLPKKQCKFHLNNINLIRRQKKFDSETTTHNSSFKTFKKSDLLQETKNKKSLNAAVEPIKTPSELFVKSNPYDNFNKIYLHENCINSDIFSKSVLNDGINVIPKQCKSENTSEYANKSRTNSKVVNDNGLTDFMHETSLSQMKIVPTENHTLIDQKHNTLKEYKIDERSCNYFKKQKQFKKPKALDSSLFESQNSLDLKTSYANKDILNVFTKTMCSDKKNSRHCRLSTKNSNTKKIIMPGSRNKIIECGSLVKKKRKKRKCISDTKVNPINFNKVINKSEIDHFMQNKSVSSLSPYLLFENDHCHKKQVCKDGVKKCHFFDTVITNPSNEIKTLSSTFFSEVSDVDNFHNIYKFTDRSKHLRVQDSGCRSVQDVSNPKHQVSKEVKSKTLQTVTEKNINKIKSTQQEIEPTNLFKNFHEKLFSQFFELKNKSYVDQDSNYLSIQSPKAVSKYKDKVIMSYNKLQDNRLKTVKTEREVFSGTSILKNNELDFNEDFETITGTFCDSPCFCDNIKESVFIEKVSGFMQMKCLNALKLF